MKLTVTNLEARAIVAEKFNGIYANDIEIQPAPNSPFPPSPPHQPSAIPALTPAQVAEHLTKMISAAQPRGGGYHDKIGMIKSFRALTGYGLKESKDLVENALVPF